MSSRRRTATIAVGAGVAAAVATLLGGIWLADAVADGPDTDGEFVLVEPGVYDQPADEINPDRAGDTVPTVALLDRDDRPVRLDEFRGRPLVVNVWFSTCPPCARELGDFATVHAEVGDRVQFVGVDPFDSVDTMIDFAEERGVTYELLRDPGREFSIELEIVAYPVTLFVDRDGRIVRQTGALDADALREALDELF